MIATLLEQYQLFLELSKSNPFVAGAIGLWGAGLITWMCRTIPAKIWKFISTQCTTELVFNNAGWNGNEAHFHAFMQWFRKTKYSNWSRFLSLDAHLDDSSKVIVGVGYGTHLFFYRYRLFWVHKSRLESSGTDREKQEFTITMLGRDVSILQDMIEEFRHKRKDNQIYVYSWSGSDWEFPTTVEKRPIETVIINRKLKTEIMDEIGFFMKNKEWYSRRGMPYKLTFVFHGKPGTGKTSLIKALASHYGRNVYTINLAQMSDASLVKALNSIQRGSMVLIEDFDTNSVVKTRVKQKPKDVPNGDVISESPSLGSQPSLSELFNELTLSCLLNTLDGIVSLNDTIIFMTTNHLENIDPALIRKGRVDRIYEIPYLQDAEIKDYIALMFPEKQLPYGIHYREIPGCDLQDVFLTYKEDYDGFIHAIPHLVLHEQQTTQR